MDGKPRQDRARELVLETRKRLMELRKELRRRLREAGAKERSDKVARRMRREAIRAAAWAEAKARALRLKLEEEHGGAGAGAKPAGTAKPAPGKRGAGRPAAGKKRVAGTAAKKAPRKRTQPKGAPRKTSGTRTRKTTGRKKTAEAADMSLQEIAPDVYACLQKDRGLGTSNSGLVNRGGGLVVDTFWDLAHTRQLVEHYARVWKEPARRVVNTHHNGDHCWGNQLFPDAEIIGHRLCAEGMARETPEVMQAVRNSAGSGDPVIDEFAAALQEWDFSGIEIKPPTTLVEERLEIDLEGIPVHLIYVGPAHTAGDLIVHLPEQGVVFAGDVVFRLCTPIGWEGTYDRWIEALDGIVALAPKIVVPGHGPVCGLEGPREMKEYLAYVRSESRRFFDQGLSALDAARRIDLGPYAGWTEPERLIFNVERAYREFRGEPFDAPIDVTAMVRGMYELRRERTASGAGG